MTTNTFKESNVELCRIDGLSLSILSPEEVEAMSVTKIVNQQIYNTDGDPEIDAINDERMGTMDRDRHCKTCMGTQVDCPGHFGHIKLEKPVYHNNLLTFINKCLNAVCFNCSHLLADNKDHKQELEEFARIKNCKSRFNKVQKLSAGIQKCKNCEMMNRSYQTKPLKIKFEAKDKQDPLYHMMTKHELWPEDAKTILQKISKEHLEILGVANSHPANMIIENLTVVPPPVRPSVQMMGQARRSEDDLTVAYAQIIKQNRAIKDAITRVNNLTFVNEIRCRLQYTCATVMDNKIAGAPVHKHKSG